MELTERREIKTGLGGKQASTRWKTAEEGAHVEELIPGIPDEITLDYITTKVPWRAIQLLSSVSRGWRQAVQYRHVYNARVRCNSTETFVLIHHLPDRKTYETSLCSMRDTSFYTLPPVVEVSNIDSYRVKTLRGVITLDGKVYKFGDELSLYVLDLAGQRQWKKCASIPRPLMSFAVFECVVMDEKIYVFDIMVPTLSSGSVVYDPKQNTWSPIKPMLSLRCNFQVAEVGDQLVLYGGCFHHKIQNGTKTEYSLEAAHSFDVYNPVKDEWRVVESFGRPREKLFAAGGKLYSMSSLGIYFYDFDRNSWAHRHSFSFAGVAPVDSVEFWPLNSLGADDELLAVLEWSSKNEDICLVQSRGFGNVNKEMVWQKIESSIPIAEWAPRYLIHYRRYYIDPIRL